MRVTSGTISGTAPTDEQPRAAHKLDEHLGERQRPTTKPPNNRAFVSPQPCLWRSRGASNGGVDHLVEARGYSPATPLQRGE